TRAALCCRTSCGCWRRRPPPRSWASEDLAGVQDAARIERRLYPLQECDLRCVQLDAQVRLLREPDAMFAADRAFQRDHTLEEHALRLLRPRHLFRIVTVNHEIDVNVAVPGMAK